MKRLLLIRHAQPEDDARGRCYGRLDVGLSPTGTEAAERLAISLRGLSLDAVYSSPRRRAVQTAELLGAPRIVARHRSPGAPEPPQMHQRMGHQMRQPQ